MSAHPEWRPEIEIGLDLAARTVADQFPELAGQPVRAFDAGWDNVVLRIGSDWVFRFIHRGVAVPGAHRERAVLLALAGSLPLPIPHPRYLGRPTPEVPWPFWGARHLPGTELAAARVPDDARTALAVDLGRFLRELHSPDVAAGVAAVHPLPVDPMRRGDPAHVAARARGRLERLADAGAWEPDPRVAALLETASHATPSGRPPVLVHGDLHTRHVLVDQRDGVHRVTGVIDWGDVALADPTVDLSVAFGVFQGEARTAFVEAYGPIDAEAELRARVLAVHINAALTEHATAEGLEPLRTQALAGLSRAAR
ncbi:phosphotransferase [Actinotalea sp. K2]|uniref:phosphotransferase n=1 Tax=Actinotalea sp. K2 TaxID=2939438 RepID=UPI002016C486|nr:phosphotransferase [Actinotalea sp. K2]MCL3863132.1 phosphotransferase [Actinotalea sp. K2]